VLVHAYELAYPMPQHAAKLLLLTNTSPFSLHSFIPFLPFPYLVLPCHSSRMLRRAGCSAAARLTTAGPSGHRLLHSFWMVFSRPY